MNQSRFNSGKARRRFLANEQMENTAERESEFASKLDKALIGTIRFFSGCAGICWLIAATPWKLKSKLSTSGRLSDYVPPSAFLAAAAFLTVKALRVLLTTVLLSMLAFERSCAPETQRPIEFPDVADALQIPSLDQVVYAVVPIVALILFLIHAGVCMAGSWGSRVRVRSLCIYMVGFQYFLLLVGLSLILFWPQIVEIVPAAKNVESYMLDLWAPALAYVTLIIAWPTLLLTAGISRLSIRSETSRLVTVLKSFGVAFWVCAGAQIIGFIVVLPMSKSDLARQLMPRPILETALLSDKQSLANVAEVSLAVTNRSGRDLFLSSAAIYEVRSNNEIGVMEGNILNPTALEEPWILLEPDESKIVKLNFRGSMKISDRSACSLSAKSPFVSATESGKVWGIADFQYPLPQSVQGRICLRVIDPSGTTEEILSLVKQSVP